MGIVESVKKGFSMSGKLLNVILIFFILNVIMGLVSLPLASPDNVGNPGIAAISFVLSVIFFGIFIFLQGGALGLVRDLHKTGECQMSNFTPYGKKYYLKILGLLLAYILIALALVLILALFGSGILAIANNAFTTTLVGVVVGVIALVTIIVLLFPIYSIVLEDSKVIAAIKKGTQLAWANFWKVLGLFLLLVLISVLISLVIGFLIGLITVPLPFAVTQVIITIVNSAVQSYIPIVMMIALMGYYLGLSKEATASKGPAT
ncbi:MAG: hypothetical protein ISS91_04955 [Candidatus Omnitrophica bacterium]|nr:hypothetical protein [Candidatus Omnitrophota bacterium]